MHKKVTRKNHISEKRGENVGSLSGHCLSIVRALFGHCQGTVWALSGHCLGIVKALLGHKVNFCIPT